MKLKNTLLLAAALLGAPWFCRAGNYTNFSVSIYIPVNVVQSFADPQTAGR